MTQVLLSSPMTDDEIKTREGEHYPRSLLQSWQWLSPRWNPGLSETKIDHLGQGDSGAGDLVSCASPGARRSPCREARSPHSRGFPWGLEQAEAEAGQASNGHRLLYPSSPRGPLLAQCSGGRGRSARALQPGSDIHPRSQPASAPPPPPRQAREGAPGEGRGRPRRRELLLPVAEGGGRDEGRPARPRGGGKHRGIPGQEPVGVACRPAG